MRNQTELRDKWTYIRTAENAAAAMIADVYWNGEKLAHHEGGYSTFRVDVMER